MNTFNINRFWLTLKWDFVSNKRTWLWILITMTAVLFLLFEFNMLSVRNLPTFMLDAKINDMAITSWIVFSFFMIIGGGSSICANIKKKEARVAFFTLPASNLEKFITRYILVTVNYAVMFAVSLIVADFLRYVFCMIAGPDVHGSVALRFFEILSTDSFQMQKTHMDVDYFYLLNISVMILVLWLHSLYILGGTFFRRNSGLFTTLILIATAFVFAFIHFTPSINMSTDTAGYISIITVFGLLTVLDYWAAFQLFKRIQVINNKWINV